MQSLERSIFTGAEVTLSKSAVRNELGYMWRVDVSYADDPQHCVLVRMLDDSTEALVFAQYIADAMNIPFRKEN